MNLFFQHDVTPGINKRFLSTESLYGAGSIFSSTTGTITNYTFPKGFVVTSENGDEGKAVLKEGAGNIHLFFGVTGRVSIIPFLILNVLEEDGYVEKIITPNDVETKSTAVGATSATLDWNFVLGDSYSLENSDLTLRLIILDLRNDANPSSITLDKSSKISLGVGEGEEQTVELFSRSHFRIFQKTERMFLWSSVDAKEKIQIPIYSSSKSKESVFLDLYSSVDLAENISQQFGITVLPQSLEISDPYVTGIEIGEHVLPRTVQTENFLLKRKTTLHDMVEELGDQPKILVPPVAPEITRKEDSLANVANRMLEAFEMIKTQDDFDVPGFFFKTFLPGPLSSSPHPDGIKYINNEWQLPQGFGQQNYSLVLGIDPVTVNPLAPIQNVHVDVGGSLWFLLRHRDVGANINAFFKSQPGTVVLDKSVTSYERVIVWVWRNVSAPFQVNLFASNPITHRPGFAGTSACLMLA